MSGAPLLVTRGGILAAAIRVAQVSQTATPAVIAQQFDVAVPPLFAPRYNIASSQPVVAIRIEPDTATRQLLLLAGA